MKQWLRDKGFLTSNASARTLVLLDGGMAEIPPGREVEVYAQITRLVIRGTYPGVVESKTPVFRLFADLDISAIPGVAGQPELLDVVRELTEAVQVFWGLSERPRVVVAEPCLPVRDEDGKLVAWEPAWRELDDGLRKRGAHVHWPDVFCTSVVAAAWRNMLIAERFLEQRFGDAPYAPEKGWPDIFDAAVYGANGLRSLFCAKTGRGHAADARVYVPTFECVRGCTKQDDALPIAPPLVAPDLMRWLDTLSVRSHLPALPVSEDARELAGLEEERRAKIWGGGAVNAVSLQELQGVLPLLTAAMPAHFHDHKFTAAARATNGGYLLKTDSRRCLNLGPLGHTLCHTSRTQVYFYVHHDIVRGCAWVQQRCFSPKEIPRPGGGVPCREYRSACWTLPSTATEALFGEGALRPSWMGVLETVPEGLVTASRDSSAGHAAQRPFNVATFLDKSMGRLSARRVAAGKKKKKERVTRK